MITRHQKPLEPPWRYLDLSVCYCYCYWPAEAKFALWLSVFKFKEGKLKCQCLTNHKSQGSSGVLEAEGISCRFMPFLDSNELGELCQWSYHAFGECGISSLWCAVSLLSNLWALGHANEDDSNRWTWKQRCWGLRQDLIFHLTNCWFVFLVSNGMAPSRWELRMVVQAFGSNSWRFVESPWRCKKQRRQCGSASLGICTRKVGDCWIEQRSAHTHTHVYSTKTLKSVKWPSVHFLGDSYSLWVFWIKYPVGLLLDNFIMRLFVGLGVGWWRCYRAIR